MACAMSFLRSGLAGASLRQPQPATNAPSPLSLQPHPPPSPLPAGIHLLAGCGPSETAFRFRMICRTALRVRLQARSRFFGAPVGNSFSLPTSRRRPSSPLRRHPPRSRPNPSVGTTLEQKIEKEFNGMVMRARAVKLTGTSGLFLKSLSPKRSP